jgi:hypothetical protein
MSIVSRRNFLIGGAVVSSYAMGSQILGWDLLEAAQDSNKTPSFKTQLSVTSLQDSSSLPVLEKLYPKFIDSDYYGMLRSSSFLVTNISGHSIRALSTKWNVNTSQGSSEKLVMQYFRPRSHSKPRMHFGIQGNKTRVTAKIPLLNSSETKLVSPFFAFSPSYYSRFGEKRLNRLFNSPIPSKSTFPVTLSELAKSTSAASMSVDAVLTYNFWVIGPNEAHLARFVRKTRNAEREEAIEISNAITAGASQKDIRDMLMSHAAGGTFGNDPKQDLWYRVKQRQAKVLLRRLNKASWSQFVGTVNYLAKQPRTITRVYPDLVQV